MKTTRLRTSHSALQRLWDTRSPIWQDSIVIGVVGLSAALVRFSGLDSRTPGFRTDEATTALMAQRINSENLPIFFGQEVDALPPFFPYLVKFTGTIGDWGVVAPRAAAALCGVVVAVAFVLWLMRAIGPLWGLAGGLLAATSFWQLMFSRQAVAPISTTVFVCLGLWLAWIGLHRAQHTRPTRLYRRNDLPWYIAAGAVFGAGFHTHASYAVVPPLVLLTAGVLGLNQTRANREGDALGPALMLLAMVVAMTPLASHYLDQPEDFRRALDLAAGLPEDLAETGDDVWDGLRGLVWRGSTDPATNLPGRPLLDPLLALWTIVGLLAALRRPTHSLEGILLIWTLVGVFAISLIGGDNPSLYLPLAPVFFALPVFGMRAVWSLVRQRQPALQATVAVLISASILGSAGWSLYDYFWQWNTSPETYVAMRGDVMDALAATAALPEDDTPLYIAAEDAERIIQYLGPEKTSNQIASRDQISIPAEGDAFFIAAVSTQPRAPLRSYLADAELVEQGRAPDGDASYHIWLLGPRTRDGLPYAAPEIPFANGWSLPGFDVRAGPVPTGDPAQMNVILLWQAPPDADSFRAEVRLVPAGIGNARFTTESAITATPWKLADLNGGELLLVYVQLPFPDIGDGVASLEVGLRDPTSGALVAPLINARDSGYVFLNDIQVVGP